MAIIRYNLGALDLCTQCSPQKMSRAAQGVNEIGIVFSSHALASLALEVTNRVSGLHKDIVITTLHTTHYMNRMKCNARGYTHV